MFNKIVLSSVLATLVTACGQFGIYEAAPVPVRCDSELIEELNVIPLGYIVNFEVQAPKADSAQLLINGNPEKLEEMSGSDELVAQIYSEVQDFEIIGKLVVTKDGNEETCDFRYVNHLSHGEE